MTQNDDGLKENLSSTYSKASAPIIPHAALFIKSVTPTPFFKLYSSSLFSDQLERDVLVF
jgi:hypothetical protein